MAVDAADDVVVEELQVNAETAEDAEEDVVEEIQVDTENNVEAQGSLNSRAQALGVSRSVWWEVSQRPLLDQEIFLDVVAAPDSSGGPSSSSSSRLPP